MKKWIVLTVFLFLWLVNIKAQHCRFDGSVVLVLDIRNKATTQPITDLDVKLVDKDALPYFRTNWSYTKTNYPFEKSDEYMRFTYITPEMVAKEELPKSVLNKYILWLGPQSYRNAFPLNLSKKLYLQDKAAINIMNNGLINKTHYINFTENTLFRGCTSGPLWWDNNVPFHMVYFTDDEIKLMEKRN